MVGPLEHTISAGDVERFAYCPLNWKRALEGDRGRGGKRGAAEHQEAARHAERVGHYQREARSVLETSFLLALVAISGATLAIELVYLERLANVGLLLVFLSVTWLAGSLYLLAFNLFFRGRADALGRQARLVKGDIEYVDSETSRPGMLTSRVLPLQGRPDYVVSRDGVSVPVEKKTGRTPRRPYDSHVLQLAAYCHLLEQADGVRPPYGVLEYPEKQFEVPYTLDVENHLVRTLLRIELAERTGEAHRDHKSVGRCAGCARREGCPERLDARSGGA
jgi:CRISPR-associated exonuclease Cas4